MELTPLIERLSLSKTVHGDDGFEIHRGVLAEREVVGIVTGMGTEYATVGITRLLDAVAVDHVVVVGITGAVDDDTPIGTLGLAASERGLTRVLWPGEPGAGGDDAVLAAAAAQLREYFAGTRTRFDLPLAPDGTPFQRLVWDQLLAIRFGETWSYGEVARAIGRPAASRAVGAANGKNPIAIIIPCHRVIGSDGTLTGYGGGMPTKQWLLAHERGDVQVKLAL